MPATASSDGSSSNSVTDWVSALTSLVAAIVSLVTLLTVYLAAMQILSRRQLYRLGISKKSLGPWKKTVVKPSLLKMQTQISTPTVSMPVLLVSGFKPSTIVLPGGFPYSPKKTVPDLEAPKPTTTCCSTVLPGNILAEASWVNFLQALDLTPDSKGLYEMQSEPELVNGIVPMRWKGRDLVAVCSMLGFQSPEKEPSYKTPLTLPTQWYGPLGWLQFRASSDGCIVEYRRRSGCNDQLPKEIHAYYKVLELGDKYKPCGLQSRAWQSISGLCLHGEGVLYLGGSDARSDMFKNRTNDFRKPMNDICDDVMAADMSEEDMRKLLWPKKADRPQPVYTAADEEGSPGMSDLPELLRGMAGGDESDNPCKKVRKLQVLNPCPGLFSLIVERELATSRGLNFESCKEFDRTYIDPEEYNKTSHPFALGSLRMNDVVMELMKRAVLAFQPDGFVFAPTDKLLHDIYEIFKHIDTKSDSHDYKHIFPPEMLQDWQKDTRNKETRQLKNAMSLCNEFQRIKMTSRVLFTIEDMKIIYKASSSLRLIIGSGEGLIWAMIACPKLFSDMVELALLFKVQDILATTISCKNKTLHWKWDATEKEYPYEVPFLDDGNFEGTHLLAAFLHIFLTYYWVEEAMVSNVALYDATIPQSVTMC